MDEQRPFRSYVVQGYALGVGQALAYGTALLALGLFFAATMPEAKKTEAKQVQSACSSPYLPA